MPLLDLLWKELPASEQERARREFAAGRVKVVGASATSFHAELQSVPRASVLALRAGEAILVTCTCGLRPTPAGPCAHGWAALLAAEQAGALGADRPPRRCVGLAAGSHPRRPAPPAAPRGESAALHYILCVPETETGQRGGNGLALAIATLEEASGSEERFAPLSIHLAVHRSLPPADRAIVDALRGPTSLAAAWSTTRARRSETGDRSELCRLTRELEAALVPRMCRTGRARLLPREGPVAPLAWDDGPPWELRLDLARAADGSCLLTGALARAEERMDLGEVDLLLGGGIVVACGRGARAELFDAFELARGLRQDGGHRLAPDEVEPFLTLLEERWGRVPIVLPPEAELGEVRLTPKPVLRIDRPPGGATRLTASLRFDYDGLEVDPQDARTTVRDGERRRRVVRDGEAERAALALLADLGLDAADPSAIELPAERFSPAVSSLIERDFRVEADGRLARAPRPWAPAVRSGIDWFELSGDLDFDGVGLGLPELLEAVRRGDTTVVLGDGSFGVLPETWLRRSGLLATATAHGGGLRFRRGQAALLDALLAGTAATADEPFARLRAELAEFTGIRPLRPGRRFRGQLRPYQEHGLAWLGFLERTGLGGCLADDMGLGKTVQVLALLAGRHRRAGAAGLAPRPSLVVAPRSLVFNWLDEARRFAPALRTLDHTGANRTPPGPAWNEHDLVLTTYGTLRRDAERLAEVELDYAILDEAQAIKNAGSATARAARLLRARHRLALTGTPIENHLGELWSLFEFLNPGMLGQAAVFESLTRSGAALDGEGRALLARALKPFLLRRTKGEVAKELPDRIEETVWCELDAEARRLYDEMRLHYRNSLLGRIDAAGLARSRMHVLEALLRLRQAACHPGLLDPARSEAPSAKLLAVEEELAEVLEGGHKAVVFSQFTSLLAILRRRLDAAGRTYEYLDGRTRDRKRRVDRFQSDPDCRLFLISLKAGGLGLNLTAADYVFLLDPWWNPAVEAQAIDRAHRIGQTRPVFAYRLVARDTIEERVLELQSRKRELADAILAADRGPLGSLTRDDLELLLA